MFFHRKEKSETLKYLFKSLIDRFDFLDKWIDEALKRSKENSSQWSIDELATIYLFTMKSNSNEENFSQLMRKEFNSNDPSIINDWIPFLNFFDRILIKLPNKRMKLWKYFDRNFIEQFEENDQFIFEEVTSWSSSIEQLEKKIDRNETILCSLETFQGKDLSSIINDHNEILLRSRTKVQLIEKKFDENQISSIDLREIKRNSSTKFLQTIFVLFVSFVLFKMIYREKQIHIDQHGNRYEGEMIDGKKNGQGKMFYSNGYQYEGFWIDDMANGQGTFLWPNGDRYEGMFKDNQRHGHGIYSFVNGDQYIGQWHHDKKNGFGLAILTEGKYEGEFIDDQMNGNGSFYFSNGDLYVGQWINDKQDGQGNFTWTNGNRYEGGFKQGKLHGNGTFYFPNGNLFRGQWIDGEQVQDHGTFTWAAKDSNDRQMKQSDENLQEMSSNE